MADNPKSLILARRAKFVAAALAGVTGVATACGGSTDETGSSKNPEPCLGIACCPENDGGTPEPCLAPLPPDASDASDASDGNAKDDADAEPQPCLAPPPGDQ